MRVFARFFVVVSVLIALFLTASAPAQAATRFIQLAIWPPAQLFPQQDKVHGVRLCLYGIQQEVQGYDLGIFTRTTGKQVGLQHSIIGLVEGDFTGWQHGFVANIVKGRCVGLQTAIYNNAGDGKGVMFGFINMSRSMNGLQLSFFNYTNTLHGLQIGIVNIIQSKTDWPVLPIVNWSF